MGRESSKSGASRVSGDRVFRDMVRVFCSGEMHKLLCFTRLRTTILKSGAWEVNRVALTGTMAVSHIWKQLRQANKRGNREQQGQQKNFSRIREKTASAPSHLVCSRNAKSLAKSCEPGTDWIHTTKFTSLKCQLAGFDHHGDPQQISSII